MASALVARLRKISDLRRALTPAILNVRVRDPVLEADDLPSLHREDRLAGRGT